MQTCLVVDAAPVVRKIASRMLPQFGLTAECVADAAEATEWFTLNGLPDLLIVAAPILGNDAADLVRHVKAQPDGADTVVLAAIVDSNLGLMTRLKRAGVAGFFHKPFDRSTLYAAIGPYLDETASPWMSSGGESRADQFRLPN